MRRVKNVAFILATVLFICGTLYIYINRYATPMNITHFAALEYCGIYIYTIYDKLNKK